MENFDHDYKWKKMDGWMVDIVIPKPYLILKLTKYCWWLKPNRTDLNCENNLHLVA